MVKLTEYINLQELKKEYGNLNVFFSTDDEGNSYRSPLMEFSLADVYDGEVELQPNDEDVEEDDPEFEASVIVLY